MRTVLLVAALAAACASPPPPSALAPGALADTSWVRVDDEDASPHNPTMRFSGAMVNGFTGCQAFTASVLQRGDTVRFDAAATPADCNSAEPAQAAHSNFLAALAATRHLVYEGDDLLLLDESRRQRARFENIVSE